MLEGAPSRGAGCMSARMCELRKTTNIGYDMGRMNMSAEARASKAGSNMHAILSAKYGTHWNDRMRQEFITNDMV